jgi:AraC-like DNA-binding protein
VPEKEPVIVLAEVTARPGGLTGVELRELRRRYPWTTRLLLLPLPSAEREALGSVIRAGVDEVIIQGAGSTVNGVRAALAGADLRLVGKEVFDMLPRSLGSPLDRLMRLALMHVSEGLHVRDLAESEELKLRAFERRVRGACAMTAREILAWARVLTAAYLLEHSRWPTALIAWRVGFSDVASLHRALRKHVRLRASQLRVPGSLKLVCCLFVVALGLGGPEAP